MRRAARARPTSAQIAERKQPLVRVVWSGARVRQERCARRQWPRGGRVKARDGAPTRPRTALLLDDPDANLGLHVGMKLHGHAIDAERLDRLVQVDESLLDVEALRVEL